MEALSLYLQSYFLDFINLIGDKAGENKLFDIRCNNLNYKGDTHVEMCVRKRGNKFEFVREYRFYLNVTLTNLLFIL